MSKPKTAKRHPTRKKQSSVAVPVDIITRDPAVSSRDPVVSSRPAQPEMMPRSQSIRILRVEKPACPDCGHSTFRNGGAARPNYTTGQMTRYKDCAHCGRRFLFVNDPTVEEMKRYWPERAGVAE